MKLYIMKCIKDPERMDECFEPDNQEERYFVKLETLDEEEAYYETAGSMMCSSRAMAWWNGYMCHALQEDLDEDSIYTHHYIRVNEPEPAVGEEYTDADGLVWERVV